MTSTLLHRLARPNRNVGGTDLVTRVIATLILAGLTCMSMPQLGVAYPTLKISLLIATEFGLICLTVGMFVGSKTYFAGVQLFVSTLLLLLFVKHQQPYLGAGVAVLLIAAGVFELTTRTSRLNALLGIDSHSGELTAPALAAALTGPAEPRATPRRTP